MAKRQLNVPKKGIIYRRYVFNSDEDSGHGLTLFPSKGNYFIYDSFSLNREKSDGTCSTKKIKFKNKGHH